MESLEYKVMNIEKILGELTILNKQQQQITEKQSQTIDKIVDTVNGLAVMQSKVDSHSDTLASITKHIHAVDEKIAARENLMLSEINENRIMIERQGNTRFIKCVSVATTITIFIFGYLYKQVLNIESIQLSNHHENSKKIHTNQNDILILKEKIQK